MSILVGFVLAALDWPLIVSVIVIGALVVLVLLLTRCTLRASSDLALGSACNRNPVVYQISAPFRSKKPPVGPSGVISA
jgi:predicted membrane-bound mannosyltransferase